MKLTPIKDLTDEQLLNEFGGIMQMSGGDLALTPRYQIRLEAARKELLRRLRAVHPNSMLEPNR